jgi:RNA polymerase sigma-70 factor (ECF subfamily)
VATTDPTPTHAGRLSSEAAGERLSELFEEHGRMVYGICRLLLRDADEAEDAAQQVFLSAHRSMLGGTQPREPAAWLGTIARNECHARIRERMSTPLALVVDDYDVVVPGVEHVAGERAEIQALCAAIAELPHQQREALVLREFYGLSYDEVRAALGLSDGAVESLLFRARKRLQTELRPARVASGALALPLALRDSIAAVVPGFASTSSTAGGLAKLASVPLFAKLAAAAATLTVAGGIGYVDASAPDHVVVVPPVAAAAEHHAVPAAEEPAQLVHVSFVQPALVEPSQRDDNDGADHEGKVAKRAPTESEEDRGDPGEVEGDSDEQSSEQSDDADGDDGGGGTEADSAEDGSGSDGSGASADGSDGSADGSDGH